MTSHDVLARIRRVGHGGTLDPMATGVLVIGVGRATRLLTYVIGAGKGYTATIRLGQSTVTDDAEGDLDVVVECSSGTYVRALARDLGAALGVGGHLTALRRTHVGSFGLAEAVTLDELAAREDPVTLSLAEAAARFFPRRDATADEARVLGHGGPLPAIGIAGPYAVFDPAGTVLAIVAERDGRARPQVVLAPAGPVA